MGLAADWGRVTGKPEVTHPKKKKSTVAEGLIVLVGSGKTKPTTQPTKVLSCAPCAVFGSFRVVLGCCETLPRFAVTAERLAGSANHWEAERHD